jgi:predicted RNA-binding protein
LDARGTRVLGGGPVDDGVAHDVVTVEVRGEGVVEGSDLNG